MRVFALLLSAVYALPSLFYPHGNDQALHWYVAQGWLRGELPFESAISGKPIGIFAVHALASLVFGTGQVAIRVFEALTLLLCAELLAALVRERGAPAQQGEIGVAALALFGLYYSYFDYWDTAHPEIWEATCLVAAALVATREFKPAWRALGCGALCGMAFMFKYPAGIIALPIAAYVGLRAVLHEGPGGSALPPLGTAFAALCKAAAQFLAGTFAVFAACALPFVIGGAWGPMWEVLYTYTSRYVDQAPPTLGMPLWLQPQFGAGALITGFALLALGLVLHWRRGERAALARGAFLLSLLVAALASVWLQMRFFSYHFAVAAPFLAAAVAYGLRALCRASAPRAALCATALLAATFLAGPRWCSNRTFSYREHVANLGERLSGDISRNRYLRPFIGMNYLDRYAVLERIGLQVRELARPGDTLCARGFAPPIYQVSGLRCPSRHVIQAWPGLPEWEAEFFRTIREHPATFIVTFEDRPDEIRKLRRMGYRRSDLPGLFLLMTHRDLTKGREAIASHGGA